MRSLHFVNGHPLRILGWFGVLMLLALIVGRLVKWEPMISGSGIPQVEGEVLGKLKQGLEAGAAGQIRRRFSLSVGRTVSGKGRPVHSAGARWADRESQGFWTAAGRKNVSYDLRGQRGTGGGLSRAAGRHDVCPGGNPIKAFPSACWFRS